MPDSIDGFYSIYMTGKSSNGFALLVLLDGRITGTDPLGVAFDGTYKETPSGIEGAITVKVPKGGTTIQGAKVGPEGISYEVPIRLPFDFHRLEQLRIETPLGPVNARFEKLRGKND